MYQSPTKSNSVIRSLDGSSGISNGTIPATRAVASPPATAAAPVVSTRGFNWYWEYTALGVCILAMSALLAFLGYIDNKRLSLWIVAIPPTAVVSILAAVARAPLGYAISSCLAQAKWNLFKKRPDSLVIFDRLDEASRGPWGSFWLIVWVKARHMILTVGAATAIVMLAFDPFFQAVISFNGSIAMSERTSLASISRSERLDVGIYSIDNESYTAPGVPSSLHEPRATLDPRLKPAIYNGFFSSEVTRKQAASATCPSGNCTWDPFTTLAVCNKCHDLTSFLQRLTDFYDLSDEEFISWTIPKLEHTNMELKNPIISSQLPSHLMIASSFGDPQYTLHFKNLTSIIIAFQAIRAPEGFEKGEVAWADANVTAIECALYFCVQAYNASMKGGELEETLVGSWSERDPASYKPITINAQEDLDDVLLYDERNNNSLSVRYDTIRSDLRLLIPADEAQRLQMPENTSTSFNLTQNTVGTIVHHLNVNFFGPGLSWLSREPDFFGTPAYMAIHPNTNLTDTFNNAARSLTIWMRDASNSTHQGRIQEWTITIRVDWRYIIAPLVTFVAGSLFCLFIIWETGRLGLPPWKTSMIATLAHSVDANTRERLRNASRDGSLDKVVNATMVKLEDTGGGLEMKVKTM